jgi:hypothetical protein
MSTPPSSDKPPAKPPVRRPLRGGNRLGADHPWNAGLRKHTALREAAAAKAQAKPAARVE